METNKWFSRKFFFVVLGFIIFTLLFIKGILPVDSYVSLCYLCLGGYVVGNVAQKALIK